MYEKAVGLGLGYLVYKRLMSELAKEPEKEGVTVKAGQLLGWETPEQFEEGLKLWAGVPEGATVKGGFQVNLPTPKGPYYVDPDWATWEPPTEDWGSLQRPAILFPEGFELVGPSRTGITRPKGLD